MLELLKNQKVCLDKLTVRIFYIIIVCRSLVASEPSVKHHYLKKWLKDDCMSNFDVRTILDWNYSIERLEDCCIQEIITNMQFKYVLSIFMSFQSLLVH